MLSSLKWPGRFANNQFGFHGSFRFMRIRTGAMDSTQDRFRGDSSHFAERLSHRGEAWILISRALNVVKTNHGYVRGNSQPRLSESVNCADRGNVIDGEKRGEGLSRSQ